MGEQIAWVRPLRPNVYELLSKFTVIIRFTLVITAMMRGAAQGGPHMMETLHIGDWVQSDTGAAGTIKVISENHQRAYVEVGQGTLGAGLVSFPVARLHKTDPPTSTEKVTGVRNE